jgi:hypothetical protein
MKTAMGRIVRDGHDFILLYPPEIGFGIDVEVTLERRGDTIIMRRADAPSEESPPNPSES